ncbi:MAG: protein kinase [Polyangiaceae bacterium]
MNAPDLADARTGAAHGELPFAQTGPFRLVRRLGEGGFAPVFLAEEVHDGRVLRRVAVKLFFLRDDGSGARRHAVLAPERILDEAWALCRVEHPHVVRFHAVHRDDALGVLALVMEHVAGEALDARRRRGPLADTDVIEAGAAIAWALSAVHDAGLVHGDVKPSNVLLGAHGYKLIDFGIARELAPASAPGTLSGTPGYLAPELLRGALPSAASDLYALGVTLRKLRGTTAPTASNEHAGAPDEPVVDDDLANLLDQLTDADPFRRPQRAAGVARALDAMRPHHRDDSIDEPAATVREVAPTMPTNPADAVLTLHPPLVGRDVALRAIEAWAARTNDGRLSVLLLRGALGTGRTRLLDAAIEATRAAPTRVLRGACSHERQSSLLPLVRALEAVPRGKGPRLSSIEEAVEEALDPGALGGSRDPRAAVEAVEEALLWAAATEPLVLAIDDAQWADPHTLALLSLLADRAQAGGEGRLFVVIAAREEPHPPAALRSLLLAARSRADGSTSTIALGPLSEGDLARVAEGVGALAPEVAQAVVRGAGGVPFFLVHALFAWRDTGAVALRDGAWHAVDPEALTGGVPGVADLVEARVSSAFKGDSSAIRVAMRALAAVALYGGVTLETLLATCGDPDAVEEALETLVEMGMLVARGPRLEHAFAQEMVRQAVRNLARDKPWFSRLHRALLDVLSRGPEAQVDAAFLAAGYDELGEIDKARAWLRKAMDRAFAAGLLAEAVTMGDRRAALASTPEDRAEAQLDTVRALLAQRRFEDADVRLRLLQTSLAATRQETAPSAMRGTDARDATHGASTLARLDLRRRVLALQTARGLHVKSDDATLLDAVDATGDLALRCDARMALAAAGDGSRALTLAAEAVALAAGGDPAIEYQARVGRAELIYASDERDLSLAHRDLTRAAAIAEATGARLHRLQMESDLAAVEAELGDLDAAIDRFARIADDAESLGMRGERRRLVQNRAALLLRAGRAKEAAAAAAEAARLSREAGDPVLCASAWSIRADALRRIGEPREARAAIDQALRIQEERGDRMRALSLLRRAEIARELCDFDAAVRDAREAAALSRGGADRWIAVAADLWETFHRAQLGEIPPADLHRALTEAAAPDVAPRAIVRSLVSRAHAWLRGEPPPITR